MAINWAVGFRFGTVVFLWGVIVILIKDENGFLVKPQPLLPSPPTPLPRRERGVKREKGEGGWEYSFTTYTTSPPLPPLGGGGRG